MRVTLFHPRTPGELQKHRWNTGHLGLAYIAACLLRRGHEVRVLDAKNESMSDADLCRHLEEFAPDIFGVTAMTHEIHAAAQVCATVKRRQPDVLTVVGGPHTTALPERTLAEFPDIDVAVIGEGEQSTCELAESVGQPRPALDKVAGIAFRDGRAIRRTANRAWMCSLDDLPLPAWRLFPHVGWPILGSRGCPFGCVFCQRVLGRQVRYRSVDNVMAEIDALEEQVGQRTLWFQDETFGINHRWLAEFVDKMHARNQRKDFVCTWGCNSRVNLADPETYRRMKEAGCYKVDFGLESGNDAMLKTIQKGITCAAARKAISYANQAGLFTSAFFIMGHPGETLKTALSTMHFAARCGAKRISVGVMVPYPGTEVWRMAKAGLHGYKLLTEDWRDYDKYFGNALELKGLSHRHLEILQSLTYIWYYLYNLRFRALTAFLWQFRREALAMVVRTIRGLARV